MTDVEVCQVIVGDIGNGLWFGRTRSLTSGQPTEVECDWQWALEREEEKEDVLGFYHTHPNMPATPSNRDLRTMQAWVDCLGKPLVFVIEGSNEARAYWYANDHVLIRIRKSESCEPSLIATNTYYIANKLVRVVRGNLFTDLTEFLFGDTPKSYDFVRSEF